MPMHYFFYDLRQRKKWPPRIAGITSYAMSSLVGTVGALLLPPQTASCELRNVETIQCYLIDIQYK